MTPLWRASDGSLHRVDDPDRHRLTKAEKKRMRRERTAARVREGVSRGR